MITKREYSAIDAQPVVIYCKTNGDNVSASALVIGPRTQTPTADAIQVQIGPGDIISNLPVMVDFDHHQVHEGETYRAQHVDVGLDLNTIKFAIVVPSTSTTANASNCPHMLVGCDVYNGAARIDIYETAVRSSGTLLTAINRERNSSNTAGTLLYHSITSTTGTLIESFFTGAGSRVASGNRQGSEFILKAATTYRVDVTGLAAGTDAIVTFDWYEDLGV